MKYLIKKSMSKIQSLIDQILQLESRNQITTKLEQIRSQHLNIFGRLASDLKNIILNQPQYKISITKLYILEVICRLDNSIDGSCFKTTTIYQLVAVSQGYTSAGLDIKGNFSRNLKRSPAFWGVSAIQNIYFALVSKSSPTLSQTTDLECKKYLWWFIKNNIELIPSNLDIYQYAIKHMLFLRYDRKPQLELFNLILEILQKYQYNEQCIRRHFRFMLQFYRTSLTQKQIGCLPQLSTLHMIKNYSTYQIDNMFAIGSLGLNWSQPDVLNCINNVLKLGITQSSYRLLKAFIEMFKNTKKYHELVQAFEKNLTKIFVFLKFPQLYQPSLKTLKQFILGPWNVTNLYKIFVPKALQFSKLKNLSLNQDFLLLLACVAEKYKQTTLVTELQNIVKENAQKELISPEATRKQILEYDWKIFQSVKDSKTKDTTGETIHELRGIVNIGNSCYMNSFMQCLFMTKQYRRKILEVSTLNVQKEVLTKLQNLYTGQNKEGKNLALIARQTVRPLAQLQRSFSLLLKSNRQAINPTNIRNISPVQFRNTHQHDSIQFGRFLIQAISRSIEHVFQGQITTEIQCPYCGSKREKKEQFLDLMLGNSNEDAQSIESMLKITLQDEHIQNLICQTCQNNTKSKQNHEKSEQLRMEEQPSEKQLVCKQSDKKEMIEQQKAKDSLKKQDKQNEPSLKSIKRHRISKTPTYTILTLKRFQYNLKENKNIKKQFKLIFQRGEYFTIASRDYLIYSFIVHRGASALSGHYFVFARLTLNEENKQWVCLNDSIVSRLADFSKVVQFLSSNQQDTPYIIFGIDKNYCIQNIKKLQQPITLRQPLQSFVQKDDSQYIKSLSKKSLTGGIDFSKLKFGTGTYFRKDDEDDPFNNGGMGGLGNNPIM